MATLKTLYTDDTLLEVLVSQLDERAMQSTESRDILSNLGLRVVRRADDTLESLDNRRLWCLKELGQASGRGNWLRITD